MKQQGVFNEKQSKNPGNGLFPHNCLLGLLIALTSINSASAGIIQWRNTVPAGEANPTNIGSYTTTIEIGNGGTTGYDVGLDVDLDTSLVPNDRFLVTFVEHGSNKVEYEFTQDLLPGESYTGLLSFENNGTSGFAFISNTIEFLAADGHFSYDLSVDTNSNGSYDTFISGNVSDLMQGNGEITPWNQLFAPGDDHRNGWFYGELTITNNVPEPTSIAYAGIGLGAFGAYVLSRRKDILSP